MGSPTPSYTAEKLEMKSPSEEVARAEMGAEVSTNPKPLLRHMFSHCVLLKTGQHVDVHEFWRKST